MADALRPSSKWKHYALLGYALIIATFGIAGGWAAVAPLDRAAIALGTVAAENSRKVVQHFEGGIISDIYVKEGDFVKSGEILFKLSSIQAKASADLVRGQVDAALALQARLAAEINDQEDIEFPQELVSRKNIENVRKLMDDQVNQFQQRRVTLEGQVTLLKSRIDQLETEKEGLAIERKSAESQVGYINEELVGLRILRQKELIPVQRVLAMERERSRLEGLIGRTISDSAKADNGITEARLQITQLRQKFQEEVGAQLLETRQKLFELRERVTVTEEVLSRQDIVAPRAGTIQNLKVFTRGQVVRSAEPLLEIVPDDDRLVIHAQLATTDIEYVRPGQKAEIRFPAFHSRRLPVLIGTLDHVSRDRLIDEATKQPYFLVIVTLNEIDLPTDYRAKVVAGMPAEVLIATGERTALSYLTAPLADTLRRSLRE